MVFEGGVVLFGNKLLPSSIVLTWYVNVVENGEMAAIWLQAEKEATLKKCHAEPGCIRLQSANDQMQPIYAELG